MLEGGRGGGLDTVLTGGGGGLILPFCILVSSRDAGCIGSGVLSLGPGPMVAGGRCWLKLLEAREGGAPCGLGGGGGFMAGCTGPVVTPRGLTPGLVFGTGLLPGGGGGAPLGFTELEMLCVVGLGLGDTLGEEFRLDEEEPKGLSRLLEED